MENENKIEKIEKKIKKFFKEYSGFVINIGRTPSATSFSISFYLLKEGNNNGPVIDSHALDFERKVDKYLFNKTKNVKGSELKIIIKELEKFGFEMKKTKFAGMWYNFFLKIEKDKYIETIEKLKNNINFKDFLYK